MPNDVSKLPHVIISEPGVLPLNCTDHNNSTRYLLLPKGHTLRQAEWVVSWRVLKSSLGRHRRVLTPKTCKLIHPSCNRLQHQLQLINEPVLKYQVFFLEKVISCILSLFHFNLQFGPISFDHPFLFHISYNYTFIYYYRCFEERLQY